MKHYFQKIWFWPITLGIATMIGLLSALLGDGWWDAVSAGALGLPVMVGGWHSWRGMRKTVKSRSLINPFSN